MMEFGNEIVRFVSGDIGGIVILDAYSGRIEYADNFFTNMYGRDITGLNAYDVLGWINDCPDLAFGAACVQWEGIDAENKKYYRFNSSLFEMHGMNYSIHQVTDITDYMALNRDITRYMSFFKKLSALQTAMISKLSDSAKDLLPILADFFKTSGTYFVIQRSSSCIEIIEYSRDTETFSQLQEPCSEDNLALFMKGNTETVSIDIGTDNGKECLVLCSDVLSDMHFSLCLKESPDMDRSLLTDKNLISVIKLYAENTLMREKLVYENEHDHLTGLYNKGKYLEMIEKEYPYRNSIAIFNFDVNNLKKINDSFGHEAGDKLIIKAADSIRILSGSNVHAYRMGGDEFLVAACDVSIEQANLLKGRWEKELKRLNERDDGLLCVIAVGMTYGEGDYKLEKLLSEADEKMYADKKSKKKSGEEIR